MVAGGSGVGAPARHRRVQLPLHQDTVHLGELVAGVDAEVGQRVRGGPVVRWLRGRVYDEIDLAPVTGKDLPQRGLIPEIDRVVAVLRDVVPRCLRAAGRESEVGAS